MFGQGQMHDNRFGMELNAANERKGSLPLEQRLRHQEAQPFDHKFFDDTGRYPSGCGHC